MQPLTAEEDRIFASGGEGRLLAYSYYEGVLLRRDPLPLKSGSISMDSSAAIQMSGTLTVVDTAGDLVPDSYSSPLSPYGVRLRIDYQTSFGGATATKQLGWFRIDDIPNLAEYREQYRNGSWAHRGATIEVKLAGLMADVDDNRFEAPTQLTDTQRLSTWATIAELAGMPITRSLPDQTIPASLVFTENRLDALYLLADNLGGILCETPDGALTVRAYADDADLSIPDWSLDYGPDGRMLTPPRSFSRATFYNVFVSRPATLDEQWGPVQGRAAIDSGPLRAGGPMGTRPFFHASPLIVSFLDADADAITVRDNHLAGRPTVTQLQCLTNPAAQGGDVVQFDYFDRQLSGVLTKWTITQGGLMSVELQIPGVADPWAA